MHDPALEAELEDLASTAFFEADDDESGSITEKEFVTWAVTILQSQPLLVHLLADLKDALTSDNCEEDKQERPIIEIVEDQCKEGQAGKTFNYTESDSKLKVPAEPSGASYARSVENLQGLLTKMYTEMQHEDDTFDTEQLRNNQQSTNCSRDVIHENVGSYQGQHGVSSAANDLLTMDRTLYMTCIRIGVDLNPTGEQTFLRLLAYLLNNVTTLGV